MDSSQTIGQLIRENRKKQGLSMEALGKKMGISGSLVGRYERDEEHPKVETVARFADALGILVIDLYPDGMYSDDIREYLKSKQTSIQKRTIEAIEELDLVVSYRSYQADQEGYPTPVTAEVMNSWVLEMIPEIAQKHNIPEDLLMKHRPLYSEPSLREKLEFSVVDEDSEIILQIAESMEKLNSEGQRVAIERIQELTEIPKYQRKTENDPDRDSNSPPVGSP